MESVKAGDKRLISYAVDLGTTITTNFESSTEVVREIKANRGVLTTRAAVEVTTTYSVSNVDAREKNLIIEHPVNPNYKLLKPKATETTPEHHRFAVVVPAKGAAKVVVVEEQDIENTMIISSLSMNDLYTFTQSKSISPAARKQLEPIVAKKRAIAEAAQEVRQTETELAARSKDQERIRQNLTALNAVSGQQQQVQRYAEELAQVDTALAGLRDRQAAARQRQSTLESELNALIEKLEF